ncbi:MAG: Txe/YoeB family addiction module toxin [Taibaiella sp.]|nr:Txe/YoeB family addiction module toxin [Taibaiella sp.]
MEISITKKAKEDLTYWKKSGNIPVQQKISKLIESMLVSPYEGLGKPEPLKYELTGIWSRRIDKEHRLVYEVEENRIIILSLRGHY